MKNNQGRVLVFVRYGLDFCWYIGLLSVLLTSFKLFSQLFNTSWYHYSIPVNLPISTIERYYPTFSANGSDISISVHSGSFIVSTTNPLGEISTFITFLISSAIILAVIYNFRKVIKSILNSHTFVNDNIKRIKWTSLLILIFLPIHIIQSTINYFYLKSYTQRFSLNWSGNIMGILMLSGLLYIFAEILRFGFEIKKENEEFV